MEYLLNLPFFQVGDNTTGHSYVNSSVSANGGLVTTDKTAASDINGNLPSLQ